MSDIHPALAAAQASWKCAQARDKEGWLALMMMGHSSDRGGADSSRMVFKFMADSHSNTERLRIVMIWIAATCSGRASASPAAMRRTSTRARGRTASGCSEKRPGSWLASSGTSSVKAVRGGSASGISSRSALTEMPSDSTCQPASGRPCSAPPAAVGCARRSRGHPL